MELILAKIGRENTRSSNNELTYIGYLVRCDTNWIQAVFVCEVLFREKSVTVTILIYFIEDSGHFFTLKMLLKYSL